MFKELVTLTFGDIRDRYPGIVDVVNSTKRIVTFKNSHLVDCFDDDSDLIGFYDLTTDDIPLLIVERVVVKGMTVAKVRKIVMRQLDAEVAERYNVTVETSKDKAAIDIVLVRKMIRDKLIRGTVHEK